MKTIEIKLYEFSELNKDAKNNAIEQIRNSYYQHNDFSEWAIDDCGLLEPKNEELAKILGKDYKFPLLKNTRKNFYFSCDRNWFIDISEAMEVTDEDDFLKWLGIDDQKFRNEDGFLTLDYKIGKDTIEFELNDFSIDFTDAQNDILEDATKKFEDHCEDILKNIKSSIDYRFTDEAIIEDIEANDYEFTENGEIY